MLKNPTLNDLVGGVVSVTLGDDEARRRRVQKSVLEREGPPTFGVAVEMLEIGKWRVHLDVGVAVDTLLAGYEPHVEIRAFDEVTGGVIAQPWLGDGVGGGGLFGSSSNGVAGSTNGNSVAGPFGFGGVNNPGQSIPSPTYQSYDRILGGWGNTGAGPPVGASNGIIKGKKEICETSSGLAAREVSEAAERRSENSSVSQTTSTSSATFLFPSQTERTPVAPTQIPCRPNNPICYGLPVLHRLGNDDFCTPPDLQKLIDTGTTRDRNALLQRVIDGYNNEYSLICNLVCNSGA